ncbi:hypothetical protein P872_02185 [Rhodonellum psychrophilum GCM71 = DSM 17998]|uniref:Uncharacterized protein n=2 Tax=Rhodonellum TaxID=336827 RepID=U5C1D1_9BACT|nr:MULTISPECIES: hypothetical protein [Rhodonellum]ERM83848.1 hypothetical protein P872_02185 [Rhodonellum psychrophilum GCM71 = DSM 17998]SDY66616.1 hypothetical protein SAMN05444412_102160 [Rhodonellum ikkaensis]
MKKYLFAIGMMFLISISIKASNEAYEKAMRTEIQKLYRAGSVQDLQQSANVFSRIAEMNKEEWLPDYYAAWAYANMGFRTDGGIQEKDGFFGQAKMHAKKAASISPNNSEIVAMQGFIIMGELSVDPNSRGQSLSPIAMQTFAKAIELNRQNPRAIFMMAQMENGMAQFFGQGPEKACGLVDASLKLFEKEASEAKEGALEPMWGKNMAAQMKAECP